MLLCSLERLRLRENDLGEAAFLDRPVGRSGGDTQYAGRSTQIAERHGRRQGTPGEEPRPADPMSMVRSRSERIALLGRKSPVERLKIACGNARATSVRACPPIVVDQDIYRVRPEMILGTVDKFAQMAWREDVRKLFARDGIGSPPSLIIQDELHLISGPLGSIVGLYETAIDAACGRTWPRRYYSWRTRRSLRRQPPSAGPIARSAPYSTVAQSSSHHRASIPTNRSSPNQHRETDTALASTSG